MTEMLKLRSWNKRARANRTAAMIAVTVVPLRRGHQALTEWRSAPWSAGPVAEP
jgi:hypothetical protein